MATNTVNTCSNGETCQFTDELKHLRQEVERLSELINLDNLTGLFNYRHFNQALMQEMERSQRTLQATSLIMVDIDHFKSVNDKWGHETGNQVLQLVSRCINNSIRKLDIACRYGGEEFAIILPGTDIVTGSKVAERIRKYIEQTPLQQEEDIYVTASAGLSMYTGKQESTLTELIETADQALYLAKKQGRNQICFNKEDPTEQQVSADEKSALFDMFRKD